MLLSSALSFLCVLTLAGDVLSKHPSFQKGLEKAQSLWKYGKCSGANDNSPNSSQLPGSFGLPSSVVLETEDFTGWSLGEAFKGRLLGFCEVRDEQILGDGGRLTFDGHSGMG